MFAHVRGNIKPMTARMIVIGAQMIEYPLSLRMSSFLSVKNGLVSVKWFW